MPKTRFVILALSMCFSTLASAAVLTVSPGSRTVEGVKVSEGAKASVADRSYALKLVGAGLRYKKVVFVKAKVYVGELFVDAPEKFKKGEAEALGSLAEQKAVAIRMTFLRDVDGEKVSNGFKEGLEENKVSLTNPTVKGFLDAVKTGGEAKDKHSLVVVGEKLASGKEAISYENAAGKVVTVTGDAGLVKMVFSIWLGKIDDSGLENLKKEILGIKD